MDEGAGWANEEVAGREVRGEDEVVAMVLRAMEGREWKGFRRRGRRKGKRGK